MNALEKSCYQTNNDNNHQQQPPITSFREVSSEHALLQHMQDHYKQNKTFQDTIWGPVFTKSIASTEMVSFFARNRIVPRMLLNTESVAVVVRVVDTHLLVKVIITH